MGITFWGLVASEAVVSGGVVVLGAASLALGIVGVAPETVVLGGVVVLRTAFFAQGAVLSHLRRSS